MLRVSLFQMLMRERKHSNARVYPGSGRGAVRPARGVCEGIILSCTGGAYSRGYRRSERGRETPRSLLEEKLIEASANIER